MSTRLKKLSNPIGLLNFLSNPKDWYVINGQSPLYVICAPRSMASRVRVYPPGILRIDFIHGVAAIAYTALPRFHTATGCGFHTALRADLEEGACALAYDFPA